MNLAVEDTAPVTRKAEWGLSAAGCRMCCRVQPGTLCVPGSGRCLSDTLAGAGGSHCSHSTALSSPRLPQAKSNTLSNGLLPELSHKKFNVF